MSNRDIDGVAGTFNSSSAIVTGPDNAAVLWAGLYWGARVSAGAGGVAGAGNRRAMSFRPAGAAAYQTVKFRARVRPDVR